MCSEPAVAARSRDAQEDELLAAVAQRAQYPLIKEYTLSYRGLNIMV